MTAHERDVALGRAEAFLDALPRSFSLADTGTCLSLLTKSVSEMLTAIELVAPHERDTITSARRTLTALDGVYFDLSSNALGQVVGVILLSQRLIAAIAKRSGEGTLAVTYANELDNWAVPERFDTALHDVAHVIDRLALRSRLLIYSLRVCPVPSQHAIELQPVR